jgi:DUF971 family protein
MSNAASQPWPTELRLHKDRRALIIAFDNGETFDLSAEYLRVKSPSAEVQGHSPDQRKTIAGKKDVAILEVNPIGNYAVRLVFDDMHLTASTAGTTSSRSAETGKPIGRTISTTSPARVCSADAPTAQHV